MCNKYRSHLAVEALLGGVPDLQTLGGLPNLEPGDEISITDAAAIFRVSDTGAPELVQMRWSWPDPGGKPVYNFRSEGWRFGSGRCLIPADGFYEFTGLEPPTPKRACETLWLFALTDQPWFYIAGHWREGAAAAADAWTMLTVDPGPDTAPFPSRQVVVLEPKGSSGWLNGEQRQELLRPSPAGALQGERAS